jgi:hypothetical protein
MIDEEEYIAPAPTKDGLFQGIPRLKAKISFEGLATCSRELTTDNAQSVFT